MTNLNAMTTDKLLELSNWIKARTKLTQLGVDKANQALVEIDAELDLRQPVGEFRTLCQKVTIKNPYSAVSYFSFCFEPIGFEYLGPTGQKDCTYCEA